MTTYIEGAFTVATLWDLEGGVHTSETEELQVKRRGSQNPCPLFTNTQEGKEGEAYGICKACLKNLPTSC